MNETSQSSLSLPPASLLSSSHPSPSHSSTCFLAFLLDLGPTPRPPQGPCSDHLPPAWMTGDSQPWWPSADAPALQPPPCVRLTRSPVRPWHSPPTEPGGVAEPLPIGPLPWVTLLGRSPPRRLTWFPESRISHLFASELKMVLFPQIQLHLWR